MELEKFIHEQLSLSSLKGIKGGSDEQKSILIEGSTHTVRHSTSCTGSDHDSYRHDSD